ncbi:hypothetical protein A2755_02300 [Candidatus Wolfebacteria bacterium RIFCSPHIGHO2_01_FULL_48_22]|uniref:ComEC/Rec2-related protein domain-containing protein n=2 Tax=Candidatus Wolfeibacteriota TaxID=1752735 RepID=A0A1F8DRG1_9BACT|nr:MAG: hypothetical protein A2755_02300 [Candidatus Wolfebacteria bacterium RIFCSPHIGHO2_01_FULL_48_22]OGM92290.1 MAG: hypothetical protein A2935_00770 [Candidatus Wolfebacteria bacterium RIFCSPLOWO2_01_FULL_47_17b]
MRLLKSHILFTICLGIIVGIALRVYEVVFVFVVLVSVLGILMGLFTYLVSKHAYAVCVGIGCVCVLLGFVYAHFWADRTYEPLPLGAEISIEGTVRSYPRLSEFGKGFILSTRHGNAQVYMPFSQEVEYGDRFVLSGVPEALGETQQYLTKDLVQGIVKSPRVITYTKGDPSPMRILFKVRTSIRDTFVKILSYDQASLATGLLIGGGSVAFSPELKTAMQNSGTTHIVALSGYNISMISIWLFGLLGMFLKRNTTFWATIIILLVFTLMTGAEASIVRAAIMGMLMISSQYLGRVYDFRQSAVAVGCMMLVASPYAIRYDAGFTLSFLSLFGIVYIAPLLVKLTHCKVLAETLAAQMAVMPVLVFLFDGFSPVGVLANVLILPLVPLVMGISFCVGIVGIVSVTIGSIASLAVQPALAYMLEVIQVFGSFERVPWTKSILVTIVYYAACIGLAAYARKKKLWYEFSLS